MAHMHDVHMSIYGAMAQGMASKEAMVHFMLKRASQAHGAYVFTW